MKLVSSGAAGQVGFADRVLSCDEHLGLLTIRVFQPSVWVLDLHLKMLIHHAGVPAN